MKTNEMCEISINSQIVSYQSRRKTAEQVIQIEIHDTFAHHSELINLK